MTIEAALLAYLGSQASVTAVVENRIFVDSCPQGQSKPYILIEMTTGNLEYHSTDELGVQQSFLEVRYVGGNYKTSRDLANVARPLLSAFTGSWSTMPIQSCLIQSQRPDNVFPQGGEETPPTAFTHSLVVWHDAET